MLFLIHGDDSNLIDQHVEKYYFSKDYKKYLGTAESLHYMLKNRGLFDSETEEVKLVYNLAINQISNFSIFPEIQKITLGSNLKHLALIDYSNNLSKVIGRFDQNILLNTRVDENIFKLVEAIFDQNLDKALVLLNPYLKEKTEGYVLSMMFYMVKNLLKYYYQPDDFRKLNPFVQSKITVIAAKSSISRTKNVIFALSEADYKIKSGGDAQTILSSLLTYISK